MNNVLENKRIYLDNASSTPIDQSVLAVLQETQRTCFGNASGIHQEGIAASRVLHDARNLVALSIGAHPDEVYFTSGGTESDNLALLGVLRSYQEKNKGKIPHIIISMVEHAAIFELAVLLEMQGVVSVSYIPVSIDGVVDTTLFKNMLQEDTILVSVMQANNEVGTYQPIREITKIVRHFKKIKSVDNTHVRSSVYPYVHTDACQSFVYEDIRVEQIGVDLLTINSSKINGPKGAGALFIRRGVNLGSIQIGGSQEKHKRAGTENVPTIAGFAEAVKINEEMKETERVRLILLRDYFIQELSSIFEVTVHGEKTERMPNNVNVSFVGYQSEQVVVYLDAEGVAVSEKSACKADSGEVSHVLKAMYGTNSTLLKWGSVRFSFGRFTTKEDLSVVIEKLQKILGLIKKEI